MFNKKGITLVEIIISVGLISVVMLFLFNLLLDMEYEDRHSSYLKENQVNRATIIKTVQEDLMANSLENVTTTNNQDSTTINFDFGSFATNLIVYKDKITYQDETWPLEANDNDEAYYDYQNISLKVFPENSSTSDCSYTLNVDSDGDGVCNYNCDTNGNGVLDGNETSTINNSYRSCTDYKYVKIDIPAITGSDDNIIDDIEIFYIGLK